MPRHPRERDRRRLRPVGRRPGSEPHMDRATLLRALIQAGTVAVASLTAREDLEAATVSVQRLGSLTSGTWRALGRDLETAVERLDRQSEEYLDDVFRRAKALDVPPTAVLEAGEAAGHLAEHREALDSLPLEEDVRRLTQPDILLGFAVDDDPMLDDA